MTQHPSTGSVTQVIEAPCEVVYDLVGDVARMGEWSPECVGADRPDPGPIEVGHEFTGRNARDENEWDVPCRVIEADCPRVISWAAGDDETGTTWAFEFRPAGRGRTEVTESFDSLRLRHPEWAEMLAGRHGQLVDDMSATLAALKASAEQEQGS
jgi:hypothetical protein